MVRLELYGRGEVGRTVSRGRRVCRRRHEETMNQEAMAEAA